MVNKPALQLQPQRHCVCRRLFAGGVGAEAVSLGDGRLAAPCFHRYSDPQLLLLSDAVPLADFRLAIPRHMLENTLVHGFELFHASHDLSVLLAVGAKTQDKRRGGVVQNRRSESGIRDVLSQVL